MIEYIYFVKCPNCEDEHFYFFNDAKECAMSQLSKKPIITQIEVNRNDFGECTDTYDLGTVWSWEDMMKDVPTDSEQAIFTKADTVDCDSCFDREFDNLDSSLEPITEETEACTLGFYDRETEDQVLVSFYSFADADEYVASHEGIRDLYTDPKYTSENYLKHINQYRKSVPTGMTIESLVEEMEENEDTVECKVCEELFEKAKCHKDPKRGWVCESCRSLTESSKYKDSVEFHYDALTVTITTKVIPATLEDPEDYLEGEYTDEFDFEVETSTVEEVLWDFLTEEDVSDVPGGLEALEDDAAWRAFLDVHFEELLEKYNDKFLKHFREDAEEAAKEEFQERYNDLDFVNESYSKDPQDQVELEYPELTVTLYSAKHDVDDWDEEEYTDSHVFLVPKVEVATAIWENWITEEDAEDVLGGLKTLEDDRLWELFLEDHFDGLFEKYKTQILGYFKEAAEEDFRERSQEEYQMNKLAADMDRMRDEWRDQQIFGESFEKQKPFLEEFSDAETHKASLTDCPECGTVSYDMKEQYCANCGLGL